MNIDRTFYCAFNNYGPRIGIGSEVDPSMTRAELVENIRRGELGYDNIIAVLSFNPVEGWAVDCTQDILDEVAAEVRRLQDAEDFPLSRFTQAAE